MPKLIINCKKIKLNGKKRVMNDFLKNKRQEITLNVLNEIFEK